MGLPNNELISEFTCVASYEWAYDQVFQGIWGTMDKAVPTSLLWYLAHVAGPVLQIWVWSSVLRLERKRSEALMFLSTSFTNGSTDSSPFWKNSLPCLHPVLLRVHLIFLQVMFSNRDLSCFPSSPTKMAYKPEIVMFLSYFSRTFHQYVCQFIGPPQMVAQTKGFLLWVHQRTNLLGFHLLITPLASLG